MIVPDDAPVDTPQPNGDAPDGRATIVAGVDGSKEAIVAAHFARELADQFGDRLLVVRPNAAADPPAHALQAISASEDARMIVIGVTARASLSEVRWRRGCRGSHAARSSSCLWAQPRIWTPSPVAEMRRAA